MNFWHWGVNFNGHANSHYKFMLDNGILFGSQAVAYEVGDLVAVHKGQGLLAVAQVTGPPQQLGPIWHDGTNLQDAYGIDQAHNPIYAPAEFKKVAPFMGGAGQIHKLQRQQMIKALWDNL